MGRASAQEKRKGEGERGELPTSAIAALNSHTVRARMNSGTSSDRTIGEKGGEEGKKKKRKKDASVSLLFSPTEASEGTSSTRSQKRTSSSRSCTLGPWVKPTLMKSIRNESTGKTERSEKGVEGKRKGGGGRSQLPCFD